MTSISTPNKMTSKERADNEKGLITYMDYQKDPDCLFNTYFLVTQMKYSIMKNIVWRFIF